MARALKLIIFLSLLILAVGRPSSALAMSQIQNIRHWVAPDHTRVVIDISDDTVYTVDKEERKLSINLEETSVPVHIRPMTPLNKPGLEAITLLPRGKSGVRIEIALPSRVQTTVFKLKPFQDQPYRIVIDIVLPDVARQEREAREKVKVTRKDRVVVIDPGHGGEAVGAVGKGGTLEKDVALAISRKLRDILNGRPGYRAFLTRDGDYYVAFKKRLMIAREYGSDLFISIHADAARNRTASGSSVYCLSTGGASNAAASILARNENLADIVGGVSNGDSADASDPIILNMFQTQSMNLSRNFGVSILENIKGVNRLKFATVQEAPFIVLKLPEIPSVLIETAYISNPKEETLLKSSRFQTRIAESLARSIGEVLPPYPTAPVIAASGKENRRVELTPDEGDKGQAERGAKESKKEEPVREDPLASVLRQAQESPAMLKEGGASSVREMPAPTVVDTGAKEPVVTTGEKGVQEKSLAGSTEKREEVIRMPPAHVKVIAGTKTEPAPVPKGVQGKAVGEPRKGSKREAVHRETPVAAISGQKLEAPADVKEGGSRPPAPEKIVFYRVKKGDTLDKIARKHGTSVAKLVELNRIDPRASLYVDRNLKIAGMPPATATMAGKKPVAPKGVNIPTKSVPETKPGKAIYQVKKGDNLDVIARKHGTTVQALVKLNRLKPSAPLYVDRKLLLPENPSL